MQRTRTTAIVHGEQRGDMVRMTIDPHDGGEVVLVGRGVFGPGVVTAITAALESMPDARVVVVDLAEVDSVDERGIGALLGCAHRLHAEGRMMVVRGAPEAVRARLRSVGLHHWAAVA